MAYNKDNYENNRLTNKQEAFVDAILEGLSQRQAYYKAYPSSRKWKETSVDVQAFQMMKNPKVINRLKEMGWKEHKQAEWTRKKALETIAYVMEVNRQDIERQIEGYDEEIAILEGRLVILKNRYNSDDEKITTYMKNEILDEMDEINYQLTRLKQKKRTSGTNVHGIYEGAKILNRMFGYDITKVEITQQDTEKENMKELSIDELKQLAYSSNMNKGS